MRSLPLLIVLAAASVAAQPVRVPGTRAVLAPPPGWTPAQAFAGFQGDEPAASMVVAELDGAPLAEMIAGMTPEALRGQGVEVDEARDVTVMDGPARLIRGSQDAYGTVFAKWILLAGGAERVVIVTATVPGDPSAADRAAIERSLLSLSWGDEGPEDLFEGLGFTLDLADGLPDRQRVGATLAAADGVGPDRGQAPLYIAGLGAQRLGRDLAAASAVRLRETATVRDLRTVEEGPVTVDGRRGYESVAEGFHEASGAPVTVVLTLVPTDAGYVIFQGVVGADRAAEWVPKFQDMTRSVRWRDE